MIDSNWICPSEGHWINETGNRSPRRVCPYANVYSRLIKQSKLEIESNQEFYIWYNKLVQSVLEGYFGLVISWEISISYIKSINLGQGSAISCRWAYFKRYENCEKGKGWCVTENCKIEQIVWFNGWGGGGDFELEQCLVSIISLLSS